MAYKFQRGDAILSGALLQEGDVEIESGFSLKIGNAEMSETDLEKLDGITDGTAAASKALVLDSNKDIAGIRNLSGVQGTFSSLTQGRLVPAGSSGLLEDQAALYYDDARSDGYLALVLSSSASGSVEIGDGAFSVYDAADNTLFQISKYDAGESESGMFVESDLAPAADAANTDKLMFIDASDSGRVKVEAVEDLRDLYFSAVSGDATVAAGGALTISADSVEGTMLNTNAADGTTMELSSDSLSVLKVPNALSQGDGIAAFSFDGSGTATVALSASAAGDGLAFSSGVLSVGVHSDGGIEIASDALQLNIDAMTDLGGASIAQDDEFAMSDAGTVKKVSFSDFEDSIFANISGQAAVAAGGAISLDVSAITAQTEMTGDVADADELMISDDGVLKRLDFSVLRDAVFADVSGDATVAAGGALTIAADSVEGTMLNTNAADGTTMELSSDSLSVLKVPNALSQGDGIAAFSFDGSGALTVGLSASVGGDGLAYSSGVLSLDLHELTAADVAVGADFIAIVDADDNSTKKESIADLVSAMAGAGLTAASGQLSVTGNDVHSKADGDTLQEGYNYFADISAANVGVDLPASPSVGDVIHVKAGNITGDYVLRVSCQGSHTIDGETTIDLESPYAAVSLVYVVANNWRIV